MKNSVRGKDIDLIFGRHAVQAGLQTDSGRVEKIWIQRGLHFPAGFNELIRRSSKEGAVLQMVDRRALDRLTGGANHQGVAIRMSLIDYADLRDWLERLGSKPATVLVLDGIQDAGNIGAIFRSACAAGVDGIIIPKHGSGPLGGTAMKTSAGTVSQIPVIRVGNIRQCLKTLKDTDFHVIGITEKASQSIVEMTQAARSVFVFGNEGAGIRDINLRECEEVRAIPMTGSAGSLNVSAAVAIVLYERVRGKWLQKDYLEKRLDFPENQHRLPDAD